MIHFFPRFSKQAADTPLGDALRALQVPHRIIASEVPRAASSNLQLLLLIYPRLVWSALQTATRSMLGAGPPPAACVINSDVEVLIFALVRALPFAANPKLIVMPFIFTDRPNRALNRLRLLYYRFVMRRVSCAICHSTLEVERYTRLFAGCGTEFVFVPWGGYVPPVAELAAHAAADPAAAPVVSAGRSGRDYPTLAAAAALAGCRVAIICNERSGLGGVVASASVEIVTGCFGTDLLIRLLQARVVAVPLRVADISAGQMVLIQAMALARPLVVTMTPTIGDYLQHGVNALLVPLGDPAAMAAAIRRLLDDPALAASLGRQAQADYAARFSIEAHQRAVVEAIRRHCRLA